MNINKFNSSTKIKKYEIKSNYNTLKTNLVNNDKNCHDCTHPHNNINGKHIDFYVFPSNDNGNILKSSNGVLCTNAFHKNNNLKNKTIINEFQINAHNYNTNNINNENVPNNMLYTHCMNNTVGMNNSCNTNNTINNTFNRTSCLSNVPNQNVNNNNLSNNVNVFDNVNKNEYDIFYRKEALDIFSWSNDMLLQKNNVSKLNLCNNSQSNNINGPEYKKSIRKEKFYDLSRIYNSNEVSTLKINGNNEIHMRHSYKHNIYEKNMSEEYSNMSLNSYNNVNYSTFLHLKQSNNKSYYDIDIETFIGENCGSYGNFNYSTSDFNANSNLTISELMEKHEDITHNCSKNRNIEYTFIKNNNNFKQYNSLEENNNNYKCEHEWKQVLRMKNAQKNKKCSNIPKIEKSNIMPHPKMDSKQLNLSNMINYMNSQKNNTQNKEIIQKYNDQAINNNINFIYDHQCNTKNKNINPEVNILYFDYFDNFHCFLNEKEAPIKLDTKLINENDLQSEKNGNISNYNSHINIYHNNNSNNNDCVCNIYHNENDMKKCVQNSNKSNMEISKQIYNYNGHQICKNYNIMHLNEYTTPNDEQNIILNENMNYNNKNLALKKKSINEQHAYNKRDFCMNSNNFKDISKKIYIIPQKNTVCCPKDLQNNIFTKNSICKNNDAYNIKNSIRKNIYFTKNVYNDEKYVTSMNVLKKTAVFEKRPSHNIVNNDYMNKNVKVIFQNYKTTEHNSNNEIIKYANEKSLKEINFPLQNKGDAEITKKNFNDNFISSLEKHNHLKNDFNKIKYNIEEFRNSNEEALSLNISKYYLQNNYNKMACKKLNLEQSEVNNVEKCRHGEMYELLEIYDKNQNINIPKETEMDEFLEIYNQNRNMVMPKENEIDEFLDIYDQTRNMDASKEKKIDEFLEIYDKKSGLNRYTESKMNEFLDIRDTVRSIEEAEKIDKAKKFFENHDKIIDIHESLSVNNLLSTYDHIKDIEENKDQSAYKYKNNIEDLNKNELLEYWGNYHYDVIKKDTPKHNNSFIYASGKEAKINKDILKEMRSRLFSNDEHDSNKGENKTTNENKIMNENKGFSSFTYASGKEAKINKDILKEMRSKLFSDDEQDINQNENKGFSSFTYASGKEAKINKDILKEMKNKIFNDDEYNNYADEMKNEKNSYFENEETYIKKQNTLLEERSSPGNSLEIESYAKGKKEGLKEVKQNKSTNNTKGIRVKRMKVKNEEKLFCGESYSLQKKKKIKSNNNRTNGDLESNKNSNDEMFGEITPYKSEEFDEIMEKGKGKNYICSSDYDMVQIKDTPKKMSSNLKSKNNFINPRKQNVNNEIEEKQTLQNISNNNKENSKLDLNINLKDSLGLIKKTLTNLSEKRRLKDTNFFTNFLIFINEENKKKPYEFNWFSNDYIYFLKNANEKEYYVSNINVMYELFILVTKELNIFYIYDFPWFLKKYNLITMSLVRKYKRELKEKYKHLKYMITMFKSPRSDFNKFIDNKEYLNSPFRDSFNDRNEILENEAENINSIIIKTEREKSAISNKFEKENDNHLLGNIRNNYAYISNFNLMDNINYCGDNAYYTALCKKQANVFKNNIIHINDDNKTININTRYENNASYNNNFFEEYNINQSYKYENYTNKCVNNIGCIIPYNSLNLDITLINCIDQVPPPSPIEFIYKLLKRYIEEQKNKKSVLQLIQENRVSYKVPINLRVEKIIKKEEKYIIILSDNFDYIYCIIKDTHLAELLICGKIKEGYTLKINSLDIYNDNNVIPHEENPNSYSKGINFSLSSNNLICIDKENKLKIGLSKYKAKRIRSIKDFENGCFFIDVVIISKSDFSYGFYDQTKKQYCILNSEIYEKTVYDLKNEMTKLVHDENYHENNKYIKLKNDLYMFLEATTLCTIQAIDFASSEKIKETDLLDDKLEKIINSLCQIKLVKIDKETYENMRKGSRLQIFNTYIQKSNRNNKFVAALEDHILDDLIYSSGQKKGSYNNIKWIGNYDLFKSHFLKENIDKSNIHYCNDYDNYLKLFKSYDLKNKSYTPIVFQATNSTYINVDTKHKSRLIDELHNILTINNKENIDSNKITKLDTGYKEENESEEKIACESKKLNKIYPSFIYTNIFKIPILSKIHMNVLKMYINLNENYKNVYFDLIPGNLYNVSGMIIHYTDIEIKELIDYKCPEYKKNMMWYKIFLLTSNGYLCCINISMLAPNFIISSYKKDFACKEREIIKRMINVEDCMSIKENKNNKVQNCDNEDNHFNSNEHININKNNNLFNYLYKCERKNTNESIQKGTTFLNDLDIFIYFNDLEFINYDQKHDIFNFRSYYHPNFKSLRTYPKEFEHIKWSITRLIDENYITYEKNKLVLKLRDDFQIKIDNGNFQYIYLWCSLIYSKCKSIELTGDSSKNSILSKFLKSMCNLYAK
ncbi:conserved Plasmodium protein, unknown function [Plasmodium berghei]|uniref:Uncharacterized protein n=2 Tax=Plasmodium berghei TaxID=5821 RepID=A0A509ASF4_PLABA|nr:conserved Plasmodium protein, unknown function [Plasmodium berghei ANKA]CXI99675.1 conserved Plasmodium protein, unknown function [Plasmodium berghei]SCL97898.1 conserved Plasmodium protein, unknown function [Plasmodium berghei]SCM16707.1 conserved Plasmodium protein, unknown function [Plasmodium berghei]SCM18505.1 conserved Plasmodium protein, unknown function [Plasmodium berghei]SCN27938.1 conserved Plasmodium protein, unknown function [Plasmodium berghei]|eukprot:XP_034423591.1 conserved Plasmodium protein, unknown function [Plasmodium berghei ANKA]